MAYNGKHSGLREWSGEEIGGISLGQLGLHVLTAGTYEAGTTAGYENVAYWVAIKATGSATAASGVEARSVAPAGGDLTADGTAYDGTTGAHILELSAGDIVYGAFDKITVDTSDIVIAYVGKTQ